MKKLLKEFIIFIVMGSIYFLIETVYKYPTPSHWSMFLVGALSGYFIGLYNEIIPWEMPIWEQMIYGAFFITLAEGLSGIVLNIWLGWNVWHYTFLTFFFGQCCVPFVIVWFFLSGIAIVLDDWLRYWLFKEERPHYYIK